MQLLVFGPFTMFLEICIQIYFVAFALSRQINKEKVNENNNLLCTGKKVFAKHQDQGREI